MEARKNRRWLLFLIAAPAAVSIWSGWVGLGGMCGFGLVHPLPGIASGFELNTAITLPVGVEAYGAYALGAWLTLAAGHPARIFAKRSAIGSLLLGMVGQVAYHLLAAAHEIRAPWPVTVIVACMPVVTLGFGAALTHLLRAEPAVASMPDPTTELATLAADLTAGLGEIGGELRIALALPPAPRVPVLASARVPAVASAAASEVPAGEAIAETRTGTSEVPAVVSGEVPEAVSAEVPPLVPDATPEVPAGDASPETTEVPPVRPRRPAAPPADDSDEADRVQARKKYRASAKAGTPLSRRALGGLFGRSGTWGAARINECQDGPRLAKAQ